jgi:hypothetical protein
MFLLNNIENYQGKTVYLICNGPSFAKTYRDYLNNQNVLTYTLNHGIDSFKSDIWSFIDLPFLFRSKSWLDPKVLKVIPKHYLNEAIEIEGEYHIIKDFPNVVGVKAYACEKNSYELKNDKVCIGEKGTLSTFVMALHVCFFLGFREVYLLGCDFDMNNENPYWFKEKHKDDVVEWNNKVYVNLEEILLSMKKMFELNGMNVYNLNPESKLNVFEKKHVTVRGRNIK